jgi:hypothetical protein
MHHFQADVFALDFPRHLPPLLAVHLLPITLRCAAGCFLCFLLLRESFAFRAALSGSAAPHELSIVVAYHNIF